MSSNTEQRIFTLLLHARHSADRRLDNLSTNLMSLDYRYREYVNRSDEKANDEKASYQKYIEGVLNQFIRQGMVELSRSGSVIVSYPDKPSETIDLYEYSLTARGRVKQKLYELDVVVNIEQVKGFEAALPHIPWNGSLNLVTLAHIFKALEFPFGHESLIPYLIGEGFLDVLQPSISDFNNNVALTEEGRKLKRSGSFKEYEKQKTKAEKDAEDRIRLERDKLILDKMNVDWQYKSGRKLLYSNTLVAAVGVLTALTVGVKSCVDKKSKPVNLYINGVFKEIGNIR